ncbi:MAG: histone deacetylase, partial [Candidatus Altiarchaeota archaeon]|nr:histone deacetylase [Candidatus Altiarchaeota archaeon]
MKTGLAYSKDCLLHTPYSGNPEVAERVLCTWEHFNEIGLLENLSTISTRPASEDDILRVHAEQHISHVKTVSEEGYGLSNYVIPDAYISPKTFDAALASAGCVMSAAESVVKGDVRNCFSLNRPPGHHSSHGPSGFCYFNNLAVAIKYSQEKLGVKKVAVFDWDAHAGNGTMDIFYKDSTVYTISIHQDPHSFYPGRGFVDEVGVGEGVGYCANIPLPAGAGDG